MTHIKAPPLLLTLRPVGFKYRSKLPAPKWPNFGTARRSSAAWRGPFSRSRS